MIADILRFRQLGPLIFISFLFIAASSPAQVQRAEPVRIQVATETARGQKVETQVALGRISPGFIGFGYETSAVAQSNYFSATNAVLIRLYRNLSSRGLIRIGGNISDHTRFVPDGVPAVHTEREVTVINRANLADLAAFARATGWRVMWGLNLGTGSASEAREEASAVAAALGGQLQSFQIGNEVDLRGRYTLKYADFDSYHSNYLAIKAAIRAALPSAAFSGPDVANNLAWLRDFAKTDGRDIQLLTFHYYRSGAGNTNATIATLLKPHDAWRGRLEQLQAISRDSGVPFRINEINSFSGGGKPGVSDTFASALWSLDYMFELAAHGCDGINLETDINQLGFISHYSPIVHDASGQCHARPEYYGMLAFSLAGNGDLLKLNLAKDDLNLSAYATKNEQGDLWLTVINKDLSRDADLSAALPDGFAKADAFRLQAPSVESRDHVTLAGTEVSADGTWTPGPPEPVAVKQGAAHLFVPHASAVLLKLKL